MATTRNIAELNSLASSYSNTQRGVKVTLEQNPGGAIRISVATPNLDPRTQTVLNKKVKCITYDKTTTNNTTNLSEGHIITPNFTPTEVIGGVPVTKKFIIKLEDTDYVLKFHLPQGGESTMYITFGVKDSSYYDGYKDYISSVPQAYVNALKAWAESSYNSTVTRTYAVTTTIRKRRLIFSFMGRQTTDISKSGKFYVDFSYQTSIVPQPSPPPIAATRTTNFNRIR